MVAYYRQIQNSQVGASLPKSGNQLPTWLFGFLRSGLPKSDPKYGARGRSARRLVLWEKLAQPSGPYHQTRQDVKPQAPPCPVLRKIRVLAHRGRKVGPMAVG